MIDTHSNPHGIKYARSCYDHLAGYLGVEIQKGFIEQGLIQKRNNQYQCTNKGIAKFKELGIDIENLKQLKRKFAYPCLDWSERKHHIGGALAAAILNVMIKDVWLRIKKNSRELTLTSKGYQGLYDNFKLKVKTAHNIV